MSVTCCVEIGTMMSLSLSLNYKHQRKFPAEGTNDQFHMTLLNRVLRKLALAVFRTVWTSVCTTSTVISTPASFQHCRISPVSPLPCPQWINRQREKRPILTLSWMEKEEHTSNVVKTETGAIVKNE